MDISVLYNKCGDLCAGIEDISFYKKRDLVFLYNDIRNNTSFLDEEASMKERIFYIKNNFTEIQNCPYCGIKKRRYRGNKKSLTSTCNDIKCISKLKSSIKPRNTDHLYSYKICQCGNKFKVSKKSHSNKQYCTRNCYITFRQYNHSLATIEKIRESNKRVHNDPDWKESKKEIYRAARKKQSATLKKKILEGTFTPCITNSWTKWDATVNINGHIKKFRSYWEAAFYLLNTNLEFEKIRIPYTYNNENYNYIVDFVDFINKILYEIKPNSTKDTIVNQIKFAAAKKWADDNGYSFVIISDNWFKINAKNIDYKVHPQLYKSMNQFLCTK